MQIRTYFFLRVRSDLFLSVVYEMERALQWENPSLQGSFFAYKEMILNAGKETGGLKFVISKPP